MTKRVSINHPNMTFWGSFLLLNCLLFLPIYWFFRVDMLFWPWVGLENLNEILPAMFLQRANLDIFRLNVELLLFVLLWLFVPAVRRTWILLLFFFLYLAQFAYAVYEGFTRSYYLLAPVFYNDFFLFADGIRYVLNSLYLSPLLYLGSVVLLGLLIGLLYGLHNMLFMAAAERLSPVTKWLLVVFGMLILGPLITFNGAIGLPETAVTSFVAKIHHNIQLSRIAQAEAARFDREELAPFYQFTQAELHQKPDIYIIFLESYGSVLYKRPELRQPYELLADSLTFRLDLSDWIVASTRSNSPTWGGGSWLSYTSAIAGLRLESHAQYLALFNQYHQEPYPHLFNYLRGQGYRSVRLSSNSDKLNDIEWQRYKDFYGVDEWLRFDDLAYRGPLYGWGPSPPDQYAIHFAHEHMNQSIDNPHVFFYITQNSHYPWSPLPDMAESWQTLNDLPSVPLPSNQRLPQEILKEQYLASIQYEMTMLVDFITKQADEKDIFVIIGDHQPARIARYEDGWDTPVHIISKNETFIQAFYEYGFAPGLKTEVWEPTMNHEGFYSLFMRNLLQVYGFEKDFLPVYMPDGVPLN